jgi:hypothetical protein
MLMKGQRRQFFWRRLWCRAFFLGLAQWIVAEPFGNLVGNATVCAPPSPPMRSSSMRPPVVGSLKFTTAWSVLTDKSV